MPPPKWGHQLIQGRIRTLLSNLAGSHALVATEMAFRPAPEYEVWQADVACIPLTRARDTPVDEYLAGAPDLVVEVLSPGNTMDEINDKMAVCMDNGCSSFWVVDPKRKRVSVTEGKVTTHYRASDTISCAMFTGQIPVTEVFESV